MTHTLAAGLFGVPYRPGKKFWFVYLTLCLWFAGIGRGC